MTKEEFLNLNIEDKINYINKKLSEGQTVIRIREDLGIGEKALQKIIKDNGYKYLQGKRMYDKEPTNGSEANKRTSSVQEDKELTISTEDNKHTISLHEGVKEDLLQLLSIKEELFDLVTERRQRAYKEPTSVIEVIQDQGIKIELDDSEVIKRTVRGNKTVFDKWDKFCSENKEFSKQDLLSMALLEYINKY